MARFGLKFNLPAPSNPQDVAQRKLRVVTNGQEPGSEQTVAVGDTESPEFEFAEDDTYTVTLTDADAKGNWSEASPALTGTVNDDIGPAAPGELTVGTKRQLD